MTTTITTPPAVHVKLKSGMIIELYRSMSELKDLRRRKEPIRFIVAATTRPANMSDFQTLKYRFIMFIRKLLGRIPKEEHNGLCIYWEDIDTFYQP